MNAQSNFYFEKINTDKGLSQSIVYGIDQDKFGNIWLATEEGAVRYNSKDAFLYDSYKGFPKNTKNRTYCLLIDSKNNIWVGTENGILLYDNKKNEFNKISKVLNLESIKKIVELQDGTICFSTPSDIWKIKINDGNYVPNKIIENTIPESILAVKNNLFYATQNGGFIFNTISTKINSFPNIFNSISLTKKINNSIFIGTQKGELFQSDVNFSFFNKISVSNNKSIKDVEFYNGNFFVGVDGDGIIELDKNLTRQKNYLHNEDKQRSISSDGVYDLFVDDQNIFWVTTYGGGINIVNPLKNNFQIIRHEINNPSSLSSNFCTSFLDVGNNTIWFGTKRGISIWNRNNNSWNYIKTFCNNNNSSNILSMVLDGNYVWIGTYNDGVYKVNKNNYQCIQYNTTETTDKKIGVNKVFSVFNDNKGNIWVGGIEGKVSLINTNNQIKIFNIQQIRYIFQDNQDNIICVGKDGAYSIDRNHKVKMITSISKAKNNFDFVTINCGFQNSNGDYVLGTNGAGIMFYNPNSQKISFINKKNNLPSDVIQGVLEYKKNEYWATTTKGLCKITFQDNKPQIIIYNQSDGLSGNEFNFKALAKLNSNELIAGNISGVTLFNPKNIKPQQYLPKIVFEELYVFNELFEPSENSKNQHINTTNELELNYSQNSIGIKFAGVLHGFYPKVKYSWMLEGFDENWSSPSFENQVNYTNLSYGDYVFKVKATNKDGKWGETRSLNIIIKRPWWASFFAYLIYFGIFFGIIYSVVYFTKLLEVKKGKEEQINMLNNITHEIKTPLSILISSLENDENDSKIQKEKLQPTIERLNNLIKQMLNFHVITSEDYIPKEVDKIAIPQYFKNVISDFSPLLKDKKLTINFINHLEKEIFYFEKNDFDKIVFNLISNAIKYSFEKNTIEVTLEQGKKKSIILKIKDYGLGIPKDQQKYILNNYYRARNVINSEYSGSGLGLMIVKNLIDRNGGKISFESEENKGTTFTIDLPSQESLFASKTLTINPQDNYLTIDNKNLEKYANYKILIVEDNKELRKNLTKSLENYFLIYEAKNGKEGLEKALDIYPDLIITDYIMPEMDGVEMCNVLKNNINLSHIPVFMMTVLQSSNHKQESIENGVTEYLEKPININILLAKIHNVFNWQEILKEKYLHQSDIDTAEKFKNKNDSDFITKLEAIVLEKIKDESFSLQDICTIVGMSRTSLYMKLKSLIDVSPQDFIILTKLKYAKKLLLQGDVNIKEVAYSCGFTNPKYFSTSFKKTFGITPSQFVKSLENNQ